MSISDVKVLIIDDDAVLRSLMGSVLRQEGYVVLGEASSGESGLRMCVELTPDLVLLDINLPDVDGMVLLPQLLQLATPPKVVMVSGEATMDRVKGSLSAGASGFVVKPISANKLLSAASYAMTSR